MRHATGCCTSCVVHPPRTSPWPCSECALPRLNVTTPPLLRRKRCTGRGVSRREEVFQGLWERRGRDAQQPACDGCLLGQVLCALRVRTQATRSHALALCRKAPCCALTVPPPARSGYAGERLSEAVGVYTAPAVWASNGLLELKLNGTPPWEQCCAVRIASWLGGPRRSLTAVCGPTGRSGGRLVPAASITVTSRVCGLECTGAYAAGACIASSAHVAASSDSAASCRYSLSGPACLLLTALMCQFFCGPPLQQSPAKDGSYPLRKCPAVVGNPRPSDWPAED